MYEWAYLITVKYLNAENTDTGVYDNEDGLTRAEMIDDIYEQVCRKRGWTRGLCSVRALYLEPNRAGVNTGPSDAGIRDAVPEGWRG